MPVSLGSIKSVSEVRRYATPSDRIGSLGGPERHCDHVTVTSERDFRQAATVRARRWIESQPPAMDAAIPVTSRGWTRSIADAGVAAIPRVLASVAAVIDVAGHDGSFNAVR